MIDIEFKIGQGIRLIHLKYDGIETFIPMNSTTHGRLQINNYKEKNYYVMAFGLRKDQDDSFGTLKAMFRIGDTDNVEIKLQNTLNEWSKKMKGRYAYVEDHDNHYYLRIEFNGFYKHLQKI